VSSSSPTIMDKPSHQPSMQSAPSKKNRDQRELQRKDSLPEDYVFVSDDEDIPTTQPPKLEKPTVSGGTDDGAPETTTRPHVRPPQIISVLLKPGVAHSPGDGHSTHTVGQPNTPQDPRIGNPSPEMAGGGETSKNNDSGLKNETASEHSPPGSQVVPNRVSFGSPPRMIGGDEGYETDADDESEDQSPEPVPSPPPPCTGCRLKRFVNLCEICNHPVPVAQPFTLWLSGHFYHKRCILALDFSNDDLRKALRDRLPPRRRPHVPDPSRRRTPCQYAIEKLRKFFRIGRPKSNCSKTELRGTIRQQGHSI